MIEKGIDQILPIVERLQKEYPDKISIKKVTNVPFEEYKRLLQDTDVLIDQLYSYTPAMNALEAMKNGTVVVSGGEEEFYSFIGILGIILFAISLAIILTRTVLFCDL